MTTSRFVEKTMVEVHNFMEVGQASLSLAECLLANSAVFDLADDWSGKSSNDVAEWLKDLFLTFWKERGKMLLTLSDQEEIEAIRAIKVARAVFGSPSLPVLLNIKPSKLMKWLKEQLSGLAVNYGSNVVALYAALLSNPKIIDELPR